MPKRLKFLFIFICLAAHPLARAGTDPYAGIAVHTLANGMTVVLAPAANARNIEVELRVNSGWNAEEPGSLGVAHLVEHALFRDERLGADQSYLQLIKEKAGGNANGVTSAKSTSFFASVPSLKGIWVLNEFSRMILNRTLTAQQLDKSRSEVLLEMGEPHNILQSFFSRLSPVNWEQPDFFETEFGVTSKNEAEEEVRRGTAQVTVAQAQEFYEKHYAPGNMVLFYSGPFKTKETLAFMRDTFEAFPDRDFPESDDQTPKPRESPYVRSRFATRDSWISVGVKFWDIAAEDELALRLYFEYLAHRLMKKVRNESGETYSAEAKVWVDEQRYGYAVVSFETPRVQFEKNLAAVEELFRFEIEQKQLSNEDIAAARNLLAGESQLIDNDAEAMAKLADKLYTFRRTYQTSETPYSVFEKLSNDAMRDRLTALFRPERRYRSLVEPPILFRGEYVPLWLFMGLLTLLVCRWILLKPFDYTAVRYVRKIKYRPAFLFTLGLLFLNLAWLLSQVATLADRLLLHWNWWESTFLLSQYAEGTVIVVLGVVLAMAFLSLIPRKLIVADNHLILKSATYFSRRFPRTAIKSIATCRPYHLATRKLWRPRMRVLHWAIWKKGILIDLKKGNAYYLGFRDADKVLDELEEILGEKTMSGFHLVRAGGGR